MKKKKKRAFNQSQYETILEVEKRHLLQRKLYLYQDSRNYFILFEIPKCWCHSLVLKVCYTVLACSQHRNNFYRTSSSISKNWSGNANACRKTTIDNNFNEDDSFESRLSLIVES